MLFDPRQKFILIDFHAGSEREEGLMRTLNHQYFYIFLTQTLTHLINRYSVCSTL
jgi:hypothetical protein